MTLRNARNAANELRLLVVAEVTVLRLRYANLHWAGRGRAAGDRVGEGAGFTLRNGWPRSPTCPDGPGVLRASLSWPLP